VHFTPHDKNLKQYFQSSTFYVIPHSFRHKWRLFLFFELCPSEIVMCHTFSLYRLSALAAIWTTGDRRGPRGAQSPITALRIIKNRSHYKIIAIVRNYKLPEICKLSGSPWWTDHAGDSIIGSSSLYISPNCRSGQTDGSSNHPLISSYGSSKSSWLYVNFFIYPLRTSFGKFSAYIVNCKPRQPAMFTSSANQRENHRALLNIVYQHRLS
jgi:hypothetical protein